MIYWDFGDTIMNIGKGSQSDTRDLVNSSIVHSETEALLLKNFIQRENVSYSNSQDVSINKDNQYVSGLLRLHVRL